MKALTWDKSECYEFEDDEAACLAFMRAQALLDRDIPCTAMYSCKAYLLIGRSTLWLARDAHSRNPKPPPGIREELNGTRGCSLAQFVQTCIGKAASDDAAKAVALTMLARLVVGKVTNDTGNHVRPAVAEAWLVAAEVDAMLAEIEAAIGVDNASGVRPYGRVGRPWDLVPREEDQVGDDYDEHLD